MGGNIVSDRVQDKAALLEREGRVVELVNDGWTMAEVAEAVGYSNAGAVSKAYWRAMKRYPAAQVEEHRANENVKLDAIEETANRVEDMALTDGDLELALKATDRKLKAMERRAKLNGLDAPIKTDVTSAGERVTVQVVPDWVADDNDEKEQNRGEDDGEG